MDRIDELERALERPVITSNQCSLWAGLKLVGAEAPTHAPGSLFRK